MSLVSPIRPFAQTSCEDVCRFRPRLCWWTGSLRPRPGSSEPDWRLIVLPRMDYRQHANNTARLRFPIAVDQVISDTALVRQHFQLLLAEPRREFLTDRLAVLSSLSEEIEKFHEEVVLHGRQLKDYVRALNACTQHRCGGLVSPIRP